MIADERLAAYINSLDTGDPEILDTIEREAKAAGVQRSARRCRAF